MVYSSSTTIDHPYRIINIFFLVHFFYIHLKNQSERENDAASLTRECVLTKIIQTCKDFFFFFSLYIFFFAYLKRRKKIGHGPGCGTQDGWPSHRSTSLEIVGAGPLCVCKAIMQKIRTTTAFFLKLAIISWFLKKTQSYVAMFIWIEIYVIL